MSQVRQLEDGEHSLCVRKFNLLLPIYKSKEPRAFNQTFFYTRAMMKVLIILSLVALAIASLEPAGYQPPGSSLSSRYLPPNDLRPPIAVPASPNRYTNPQNVIPPDVIPSIPSTTYLPSRQSVIPPTNYLPANRQTSSPFSATMSSFSSTTRGQSLNPGLAPSNIYLPGDRISGSASFAKSFPASIPSLTPSIAKVQSSQYLPPNFGNSRNLGYNTEVTTPAKYDFEYNVNDEYGNDFGHKEKRSGDATEGVYTVLLPDGRKQIVHYQADQNGFRPRISYETGFSSGYDRNTNLEGPY